MFSLFSHPIAQYQNNLLAYKPAPIRYCEIDCCNNCAMMLVFSLDDMNYLLVNEPVKIYARREILVDHTKL